MTPLVAILTLAATAYIVTVVPDFLVRFVLWLLTHTFFRIRIVDGDNVPFRGPALLVSNHMSHADAFLIGGCIQRFVRFMVNEGHYERFRRFFRMIKAIPVPAGTRAAPDFSREDLDHRPVGLAAYRGKIEAAGIGGPMALSVAHRGRRCPAGRARGQLRAQPLGQ